MSQEQIYPVEFLPARALKWQAGEDYSTGLDPLIDDRKEISKGAIIK